jgi:hypothetical protein
MGEGVSEYVGLVMAALIIIEAMAIVALAAYYSGRQAKVAPIIAEYERLKREEELRAHPEGLRDSPEESA